MTRNTRKRIFYSLLLAFFVISGIVISYAEGWRFDFTNLRTEQVGAIFVRSYPKDAQITLDGKAVENKSGFLSAGTLISNLRPGHYTLNLKESGYLDWTESAEVAPTLVAEFKYAVLVPQNATSAATTSVEAFSLAAGASPVIVNTSGTVIFRGKTIGHGAIAAQSPDARYIILKNATTGNDTLYDLTAQTSTRLGTLANVAIDPYDPTVAVVANPKSIISIDLSSARTLQTASSGPSYTIAPFIAFSSSHIAWSRLKAAATSSEIVIYDKFLGSVTATSSIKGGIEKMKWITDDDLGIVASDGSLYDYRASAGTVRTLADDVKDFYPTDNGDMVAALENRSIEIIPISTGEYYRFNPPKVADVKSLSWYKDKTHLFLEYSDHVGFLDFADTGLHNLLTVSEGVAPFYNDKTNALYLIDPGQRLIRFDFPQ